MPKSDRFKWHPGDPPPQLEGHSKAKLAVLRRYLRAYFDKLNIGISRDKFKFDLVDGFAGGGVFKDGSEIVPGTPLIMLEESEAAINRLNEDRTKPIDFDFQYYFVDIEKDHTDYLENTLTERGYLVDNEKIIVRNGDFKDEVDKILDAIRRRQPRAGRSIFLLDQTGYSQVELETVRRILETLRTAEVILTFAVGPLMNLLQESPRLIQSVAPLGLKRQDVADWIQLKKDIHGTAIVQRTFLEHIKSTTGVPFYTPFFIRPKQSRRSLLFIHLSKHPTARDVMIECHWESFNTFEHPGSGSFEMLGWDALRPGRDLTLFRFGELEKAELYRQLLNEMPQKLHGLASKAPLSVEKMHRELANETAAPFATLEEVVRALYERREIDIIRPDGKPRQRDIKHLRRMDKIAFSKQLRIPPFSRRKNG